jgi:hypothetical protein
MLKDFGLLVQFMGLLYRMQKYGLKTPCLFSSVQLFFSMWKGPVLLVQLFAPLFRKTKKRMRGKRRIRLTDNRLYYVVI